MREKTFCRAVWYNSADSIAGSAALCFTYSPEMLRSKIVSQAVSLRLLHHSFCKQAKGVRAGNYLANVDARTARVKQTVQGSEGQCEGTNGAKEWRG
jgi:hypothetical protein